MNRGEASWHLASRRRRTVTVRELEKRIERAEQFGDPSDPAIETPLGIPQSHEEHVSLMCELTALAFQTDSTRIVSLLLGHDGDNRSFDFIGVSEGHHDLTHHQNKEDRIAKVASIDLWYAERFAKFLKRLDSIQDVEGNTLLHNSMIVYGSGNADGNRHSPYDLNKHPLQDGQRAMRLVRSRAAEWGIDPTRIGIMGFSAGGEVASLVTYTGSHKNKISEDPIDRVSSKPNFQILIYPGPLGIPETLPEDSPTAFLVVANDDGATRSIVDVLNKYRAGGLPVEAHIYTRGGHAFNMGKRTQLASIRGWSC